MTSSSEVARLERVYQEYDRPTPPHRSPGAGRGDHAIHRERDRALRAVLEGWSDPWQRCRILDVGCGVGNVLQQLVDWGARPQNLSGVDLLKERIERARQRLPGVRFEAINAERLPLGDAAFDLVFCFTVFSSILDDAMTRNVAGEVARVLRPGGGLVWYDLRFDNPANRNVIGITRPRLAELFPAFSQHLRTITLLPPLARRLGPLTPALYPVLAKVPALRTHHIGVLQKPASDAR